LVLYDAVNTCKFLFPVLLQDWLHLRVVTGYYEKIGISNFKIKKHTYFM